MPTSEAAAKPTRAEQMPAFLEILRPRSHDTLPIGLWEVDRHITLMNERGLFRAMAQAGVFGMPHVVVRRQLMNAALNAHIAAETHYRPRRNQITDERNAKVLADAVRALKAVVPILTNGMRRGLAEDADALARSIEELRSPCNEIASITPAGPTTDFLHQAFVHAMLRFWHAETGEKSPRYPNKGLLVDLAVATWLDAKFSGDAPAKLHGRMTKWFAKFGKSPTSSSG